MCGTGELVSIEDAARMLETTELRLLMMVKRKELEGRFYNDSWYISKDSLYRCEKPAARSLVRPGGCGGGCGNGCGGH